MKYRSKPALSEGVVLLPEGLVILDVEVSLVHNNKVKCVGQEHEVGVFTRLLHQATEGKEWGNTLPKLCHGACSDGTHTPFHAAD